MKSVSAIALALLLTSAPASAQLIAPPGGRPAANGIKLGDGRLHPFLDLELRLDSASGFYQSNPGAPYQLRPELLTLLRPGARYELAGSTLQLDAAAQLDVLLYTGLLTRDSFMNSRVQGAGSVGASYRPVSWLELKVADQLVYSDRTVNPILGVGAMSFYNALRGEVPIRPGGALEVIPHVSFALELFQPTSTLPVTGCGDVTCQPTFIPTMSYTNLQLGGLARYKFLPKTALLVDVTYDLRGYPIGASLPASLLKAQAGLAGLITPKIAVTAKVGWGQDFGTSGALGVIGQLEGAYLLNEATTAKAGYLRTLEPVPAYGVYGDDRLYFEGRMLLFGRMSLRGYAAVDWLFFHARSGRSDFLLTVDVAPEYQLTSWLLVAGGYTLGARTSTLSRAATVNYARHEAYARATFVY